MSKFKFAKNKEFSVDMKLAKSYKIKALILAFAICVSVSIAVFFGVNTAKAEVMPTAYFTVTGDSIGAIEFDQTEESLAVTAKEGQIVSSKNQITFDDTTLVLKVPEQILKFKVSFSTKSFDVNGYKDAEDNFITNVNHELVLESTDGDNYVLTYLDKENFATIDISGDRMVTIKFAVNAANLIECTVNGSTAVANSDNYKVRDIDKIVSRFYLTTEDIEDSVTEDVIYHLKSVNTKSGDDAYTQTFKLNDEKNGFSKDAKPRVALNDSFFTPNNTVIMGREYTITTTAYALIKSYAATELDITPASVKLGEDSKILKFNTTGTTAFNVELKALESDKVLESYTVNVVARDQDGDVTTGAPEYVANATAIESFEKTFKKSLISGEDKDGNPVYVRLGTNEYLTLPSFENFVTDNDTSYQDLKYTVYYKTPDSESTYSSALKIPLTTAGEYKFFVAFKDRCGNEMQKTDFIKKDAFGNEVLNDAKYGAYVFTFTILDNSVMDVSAATSQGDGYVGISYTATDFEISATGYTTKYELFYAESKDTPVSDWVKIYKLSEVDKDYNENGFTYEDLSAISYDGSLTFIPDRTGYYKITCTVSSSASSRAPVSATTTLISVLEKPVEVKVDNHWFENNVWSVVFLSVGTLCLIGIIVLLCIKPKVDLDEEPKSKENKR